MAALPPAVEEAFRSHEMYSALPGTRAATDVVSAAAAAELQPQTVDPDVALFVGQCFRTVGDFERAAAWFIPALANRTETVEDTESWLDERSHQFLHVSLRELLNDDSTKHARLVALFHAIEQCVNANNLAHRARRAAQQSAGPAADVSGERLVASASHGGRDV
jgi:hypothetical protein